MTNFDFLFILYKYKINQNIIYRPIRRNLKMFKNLGVLNKDSLAEKLYNMSFDTAGILISRMDLHEKAKLAEEIDRITLELHEQANDYGQFIKVEGCSFPVPKMSPDEYMFIMGMIKRYGILLDYTYEIGNIIRKDAIEKQIEVAQHRLAKLEAEKLMLEMKEKTELKKYTNVEFAIKKVSAELDSKKMDAKASIARTSEIMDMAAQLSSKFFINK